MSGIELYDKVIDLTPYDHGSAVNRPSDSTKKLTGKKVGTLPNRYFLEEMVGKGDYGRVYRATNDGNTFAVKQIPIRAEDRQQAIDEFIGAMGESASSTAQSIIYLLMFFTNVNTLMKFIPL